MTPFISQILDGLGINVASAAAGFFGGVVHIFWYRKTKPFDACGALVGGTLTAIYMSEPLAAHTGLPTLFVGFLIGVAGLQGLAPVISKVRQRLGFGLEEDKPHESA